MATRIPDAKYVELKGVDHLPWFGDSETILAEIEEFLTGVRPVASIDRVLSTVLFVDVVRFYRACRVYRRLTLARSS